MKETNGYVWKLGEILVHQGWLDWGQLENALAVQRKTGHFIGDIANKQGSIGKKEASILYLGEILIRNNWVTWEAIGKALFLQREDERMLGDILLENNWVETDNLYQALAIQHNIPFVDLNKLNIPLEALKLIPRHIALERRILPLLQKDHVLVVAISNPSHLVSERDLNLPMIQGCKLHYVLSSPAALNLALRRHYEEEAAA